LTNQPRTGPAPEPARRLFRFERATAGDFPFYGGDPVELSARQWLIVLAGVAAGFGALAGPFAYRETLPGGFLFAFLFFAIPLSALAYVAGSNWTAIFRRLVWRDLLWIVGIALANAFVTMLIAVVLLRLFDMDANPVGQLLGDAAPSGIALFFLKTLPQLFGEEVVSILPFLALMWWGHRKLGLGRGKALLLAWFGVALLFGALHLPTYNWNFVQCFVVIGSARLVLILGYIATKNIWVSTGSHILNDWLIFTLLVVLPRLA
jgi:membrane protease YdiL (CAAX protease family)